MTNKKLYSFEFEVLETVSYQISVEAEDYDKAADLAQSKIGDNKYVTHTETEFFECTFDEKQFLEGEEND